MSAFSTAFDREVAHIARDRWDRALLLVMPLVLLGLMAAMLLAGSPRELPVAVVAPDEPAARAMVRAIDETDAVRVVARPASEAEALALVREGRIVAFLEWPARAGSPPRISYNASYLSAGGIAERGIASAVSQVALERALEGGGVEGLGALRANPPRVSVALLGNPGASFEWYLQALVDPAILHLLVACATAMAMGRELKNGRLGEWARGSGHPAATLTGKLLPYVLIVSAWGAAWMIWISGVRGWAPAGSLMLVFAGQVLLYAATAAISALLVAATRETSTALAASAVYAGSALAYSGGSLPVGGASLLARGWSAALPFTHYLDLQMDQWLGAPASLAMGQLGLLGLYVLVPGALAVVLLKRKRAA
ncbi:ABC transporter permease [Sphingomicrobium nitratireducens]|uniref:ABC transporter permease n=1 Tax=Sphingomicrobium nitratireducens TaxID=2964666 RepID=UPI00223F5E30|nr:ABC transporter permease [Sphingomicrobium nitratireducens]